MASRVRVVDLETAGNGPYDVCEIGWQDVVQPEGAAWSLSDDHGARFVNPGRPISPDTMAVHHIIDDYVIDAPLWKTVAPEVLQPTGGVVALAAHRAAFEQHIALLVWPEAPLGYAPGNVHSDFGRNCRVFRTRCCATNACRWGWFMRLGCQPIAPSPTPTSQRITSGTC